jgi:hypothetical protein
LHCARRKNSSAIALLLLFLFANGASGQSGRHAASKLPQPLPPVENRTANPPETNSGKPLTEKTRLLLARQTTRKHLATEDVAFASFVKRLNEYQNLEGISIGDMGQSKAQRRAKNESETPVVVLTFDIDSYASGTIILNSQDLEIEYFLFAPRSGKKQTQGKVYFQGVGSGRLRKSNWPNGTPVKMTPEAAGIEAAESLYQWLVFEAARKKQNRN